MIFFWLIGFLWIAITLIAQFSNPFSKFLLQFDILGLIPNWTFFAPRPSDCDLHLLVRFIKKKELSEWFETELTVNLNNGPKSQRAIFNPHRRIEKLLFDFTSDLVVIKAQPAQIRHLTDYILILQYCEEIGRRYKADKVQFMIAGSNLTLLKDLKMILVSDMHEINYALS